MMSNKDHESKSITLANSTHHQIEDDKKISVEKGTYFDHHGSGSDFVNMDRFDGVDTSKFN